MRSCILLLFLLCLSAGVEAQEKKGAAPTNTLVVPNSVKMTFDKEFPGIQAKWEADNKNYKAIYTDPKTNSKGIIVYDPEGQVIRHEREANLTETPN